MLPFAWRNNANPLPLEPITVKAGPIVYVVELLTGTILSQRMTPVSPSYAVTVPSAEMDENTAPSFAMVTPSKAPPVAAQSCAGIDDGPAFELSERCAGSWPSMGHGASSGCGPIAQFCCAQRFAPPGGHVPLTHAEHAPVPVGA